MQAGIAPVRVYAYLSIVGCLIIIAAECLRFSVFFTHKSDLINACANEAQGFTSDHHGGFWGSTTSDTLDEADAQDCKSGGAGN